MAMKRHYDQLLLRPSNIPPSRDDFEVIGTFNPGVTVHNGEVLLLVRVAERPREERPGFVPLPRWEQGKGLTIDWLTEDEVTQDDPRAVKVKATGRMRLTYTSYLRLVRCGDGRKVREVTNVQLWPETELEEFGVEDPRITRIGDRYYITYVAVSRYGVSTALASTADFQKFERMGVIFCPENKDVVLFPEKFGDDYVALHRPVPGTPFNRPEMWIARSIDLTDWGRHRWLHGGGSDWETGRVGAGAPPIRVEEGWLEIYHGNRRSNQPGKVGTYSAGAMLLDADDPSKILRRTREPILTPTTEFERIGFVPNVVFPTGVVEQEGTYLLYLGAADTCCAVVELDENELMGALKRV
ncbi:MAG: glycosylase [Planctomycetes bacterium SCN 63-9]|nr:MAG: glycosylase [Planctomycetes bacterium SCN 63-9]